MIAAVRRVTAVRTRLRGAGVRGRRLTVEMDAAWCPGRSPYLYARVLDRCLGLFAPVNAFTRVEVVTDDGRSWRWPARFAGRVYR